MRKVFFVCFILFPLLSLAQTGYKNEPNAPATVTYKKKDAKPATKPASKPAPAKPAATTPAVAPTPVKTAPAEKLDTIIKLGGKRLICTVIKINPTSVQYIKPESPTQLEMPRKEIELIIFRTGRKEIFNKPIFSMIDKTQWQAVLVTENEADVMGLYKIGIVRANAASGSRSPKAAKNSATIRLQKKTANMGALIVLVVRSEMKGGYGEIPGWELEGIAYSDTPPADTASVNAAIRKMIERNRARVESANQNK